MKKLTIACLFLAGAFLSASAQLSVVKDAKKNFKVGDDISVLVETISPAFTNPESANLAETWYTAGELAQANFDKYFNQYALTQKLEPAQMVNMGKSLLKAYEYFNKAYPLDQLPDEKGKVKPKYTSKIVKTLASDYEKFNSAASVIFDEAKDYQLASELWDVYFQIPSLELLGKSAPQPLDAKTEGTYRFYNGLAKFYSDNKEGAYADLTRAHDLGFEDEGKQIYVFLTNVAGMLGKNDEQLTFAKKGYERSGDTQYMNIVINSMLQNDKYEEANAVIDDMLKVAETEKAQAPLYLFKGLVAERTDREISGIEKAIELYQKCIALDPEMGAGYYNLANQLVNKANAMEMNASDAEFETVLKTSVPIKLQAAEYYKKAYTLDPVNFADALHQLNNLSYGLNNPEAEVKVKAIIEELQ